MAGGLQKGSREGTPPWGWTTNGRCPCSCQRLCSGLRCSRNGILCLPPFCQPFMTQWRHDQGFLQHILQYSVWGEVWLGILRLGVGVDSPLPIADPPLLMHWPVRLRWGRIGGLFSLSVWFLTFKLAPDLFEIPGNGPPMVLAESSGLGCPRFLRCVGCPRNTNLV